MPTFVYQCEKCDHVKEETFLMISDVPSKVKCSKCNNPEMKKLFAPPKAIIYKCKGFYCTDKND
jgi:putative FmdB family regulatory protein